MKRLTSKEIALAAIACAAATIALTLGSYVDVLLGACYILAIVAVMVPLSKDMVWGAVLCFVSSLLLSFLFCGFSFLYLLPFAVFFGLHPIANHLQLKYIKKVPLHVAVFFAKAVWFDLAMWLCWEITFVPLFRLAEMSWYPLVQTYFFLILFLGGTLFFAAYDAMIVFFRRSVDVIVRRIGR